MNTHFHSNFLIGLLICLFGFASIANASSTMPQANTPLHSLIDAPQLPLQKEKLNTISSQKKQRKKGSFKQKLGVWLLNKQLKKAKKKQQRKEKDDRPLYWATSAGLGSMGAVILDLILLSSGLVFVLGVIAALVFGAIGMSNSGKDKDYKGKGLAITSFVFGILGTLFIVLAFAIAIILIASGY